MRPWQSIIGIVAVGLLLAVVVGAPSTAHAERWWGSGDVCMDLDSVRIITNNGTRYVAFRQQLCKGSGILWWAVADSDCATARGKDANTVDLYVYDADARQWRTADEFFNFPSLHEDEHDNAGVACNWAHPQFP
ncbi:MAG TPA: hypothetical protein VJS41_02300 [Stellaceae bacterium]|nr:hypothetical protein [Stellaceae bacterium]